MVVLSNNDGCIISRSNEAKQLGIPMGAPFFKWEHFCKANKVAVFSSNYELYGDMSRRIMTLLKEDCIATEVYSIDEAFLSLPAENDVYQYACVIQEKIKMYLGMPVSIGIGRTKTLAKIANYLAKNKTQSSIYHIHTDNLSIVLPTLPVEKIWGIGRQLALRLKKLGIYTGLDLFNADAKQLRLHFNVVLEKIIQEIQGTSCLSLETIQSRKQIISSRSFGIPLTSLTQLEEAVSYYATLAAEKLRKQHSTAQALAVFIQTNRFNPETFYENSIILPFSVPTADTRNIIRVAKKGVKQLFKANYAYQKAGIVLLDLLPHTIKQHDMWESHSSRSEKVMAVIDEINASKGKETIFYCAQGIEKAWKMRCNKRSARYTTRWQELPVVF